MWDNDPTITKAVYAFTTFHISIHDLLAKGVKDITNAVTFRRDSQNKRFTSIG